VPPLDPIVSLSVALAEAPGTCAFFLGSGVSRDAGVPTGTEVMREGLRRLWQLEHIDSQAVDDDTLDAWLAETGRSDISYSDLLELIAPDLATRREYLAGFFEGTTPGPTHEALADLAAQGTVRVFVTTNFDRLLEHALQSRGLEPVVLASDADIAAAMPREHASCVVIKPHGDFLRQTIRNTPAELAVLEPAMTEQLREVFDRYGLVILGYSGSDEAIAAALKTRQSRYGLWWVARGELGQAANDLREATGGRLIQRPSAAEFLADLRARLAVFEAHPSGQTPASVHDETLNLLKGGQSIALAELLRREQLAYERDLSDVVTTVRNLHPSAQDAGQRAWEALRPVLERRLASLLPLALYDDDALADQTSKLARSLERRPSFNGFTAWTELPEYAATWLGSVVGALLTHLERLDHLRPVLTQRWTDQNGRRRFLLGLAGETQHVIGTSMTRTDTRQAREPGWAHWIRSLDAMAWLEERYPELYGDGEPQRSLAQFDFLLCLAYGFAGERAIAWFGLSRGAAEDLALRLHDNPRLRERLARAIDLTLEEFDAGLDEAFPYITGLQVPYGPAYVRSILQQGRQAF